jgi:hypothetical protein
VIAIVKIPNFQTNTDVGKQLPIQVEVDLVLLVEEVVPLFLVEEEVVVGLVI